MIKKFSWPWEHYLVDDFLPEDILQGLKTLPVKSDNSNANGTRTNVTGRWFFTPDKTDSFTLNVVDWIIKNKSKFEQDFKYDLSHSYLRVELAKDDNGFFQERHLDTLEKRITMIVFVSKDDPNVDLGTDAFIDDNSDEYKRAEWKENRCLVFKPEEHTWHGFTKREFIGERRVLLINFVDKDQWNSKDQVWDT